MPQQNVKNCHAFHIYPISFYIKRDPYQSIQSTQLQVKSEMSFDNKLFPKPWTTLEIQKHGMSGPQKVLQIA